jgi:hypothetical protein
MERKLFLDSFLWLLGDFSIPHLQGKDSNSFSFKFHVYWSVCILRIKVKGILRKRLKEGETSKRKCFGGTGDALKNKRALREVGERENLQCGNIWIDHHQGPFFIVLKWVGGTSQGKEGNCLSIQKLPGC